ncbi:DUF3367 domain-containing protein [Blastococcus sp. TBT05-19]|uniref:DUF3367 domain-containing protein n=1 Tax=Blastococcus sp. TBT05-19 TaxID=2250581 RepID=UPI000DEB0366|nr:DUF3367 domain-containing protein [Blastococcus sp. TBT05-19]RBY90428.1 DUF3367 domain-containing protein [Blastococcus sp. TBT05-19]
MASIVTTEPAGHRPAGSVPFPGPTGPPARSGSRLLERARLVAVYLGFLGLVLTQQPGRVVADTKLDLAVDPLAFLGRALQLWEPEGYAGQVQNQAYGYLFPMGPFFAAGNLLGIPTWVVQRLWWAVLLSVAFYGVVRLADRLGLGTPGTRLVGGLAYALAPRMISGIGLTSIEVLPMALAPWVLIPLVTAAREGSPRRAAALSGLAVFCVGGVNAVATSAVLPLAALWLLMLPSGPRKRRLIGWWVLSVALATAWWLVPLLLLGRYSPPFLDYIETAAITTAGTELVQVLRGTTQWLAGLGGLRGPSWPAGFDLLHAALPVAASLVVATAGVAALLRRDLPHRRWLVLGLLTGVALVSAGHVGTVAGAGAGAINELLDGALAPLRNVHKFDPVLRLPLALGAVHLLAVLLRAATRPATVTAGPGAGRRWWGSAVRLTGAATVALIVAGVAGTAQPAVAGRLTPPTGFLDIPGYWQETATWLGDQRDSGRALLVPATSFGTYLWGSTSDEPLQPLAESEWDVRNAIPLTPTGHIRAVDVIEDRLGRGEGSEALTRFLARSGYSHVVVRNDLDAPAARSSRLAQVHQALAGSPGIVRVAGFGPELFAGGGLFPTISDGRIDAPVPAVEIYAIGAPPPAAWTVPLEDAVEVVGGPDAVLALEEHGLLQDRPAIVAGDNPEPLGATLVSDALVRRERNPGVITGAASAGMTEDDPQRLDRPARDYLLDDHAANESVVRIFGATVSASSSGADADNPQGVRPGEQPFAAVDGDPSTAWRPAPRYGEPAPDEWRIELDRPLPGGVVTVRFDEQTVAAPPPQLRVVTDAGSVTVDLEEGRRTVRVRLPEGTTRSVRIAAEPEPGPVGEVTFGLAEVTIPGLQVSRSVEVPAPRPGSAGVAGFAFDAANPATYGCVTHADGRARCTPSLVTAAEEPQGLHRSFRVPSSAGYDLSLTVRPRPGAALDALVAAASPGVRAEANGTLVPDPVAGPWAAVDGDPRTTWLSEPGTRERLTVSWPTPRQVSDIRLRYTEGTAAARPAIVAVSGGGIERLVTLDRWGNGSFPALTTDTLTVEFLDRVKLTSIDTYTGEAVELGVGVSELEIAGVPRLDRDAAVELPCGEGPDVVVDGARYETSLRSTVGELLALAPLQPALCGPAELVLGAGRHDLVAESSPEFTVESATLRTSTVSGPPEPRGAVDVVRWEAEYRELGVGARAASTLLVVPENVNDGWRATLNGVPLAAVQVDGWQQGYVLPAGGPGTVELTFGPGGPYSAALLAGAVAVVGLALLARLPARVPAPGSQLPAGRVRRPSAGVLPAVGAVLLLGVIGGYWALLAAAVLAAVAVLVPTRRTAVLTVVTVACLLAGGGLLVLGADLEPVRQVLASTALAAVTVSLVPSALLPGGRADAGRTPAPASAADARAVPAAGRRPSPAGRRPARRGRPRRRTAR